MPSSVSVPLYREINECHAACGFSLRSDLPEFHIFRLEEAYPGSRAAMPPYRRGFYQLTYLEPPAPRQFQPGLKAPKREGPVIISAAPEHALSWVRDLEERGAAIYFKPAFLFESSPRMEEVFPFFDLAEGNTLAPGPDDGPGLRLHFEQLHAVFHSKHAYRRQKLAALLLALLYDCRALFDRQSAELSGTCAGSTLVRRFQDLLWQCSLSERGVDEYARCLHVSADHLSASLKKNTGRTPREFIADRIAHEARRLLLHTDLNVSAVADHLRFSEPTHFARFFKRRTGLTPLEFRRENAPVADFPVGALAAGS